jgi:hypothetical protein
MPSPSMSTIEKDKMKDLIKLHQQGPSQMSPEIRDRLMNYAKEILDRERHQELEALFDSWRNEQEKPHDLFLAIIKFFILSPVEKSYI